MEAYLDPPVDIHVAESILLDAQNRLAWDTKVAKLEVSGVTDEIETVYTESKFPWPMNNREFIDHRLRSRTPDFIKTIFYGVEHHTDYPIDPHRTRGLNHFGYNSFT
jgi:hypothetical protein